MGVVLSNVTTQLTRSGLCSGSGHSTVRDALMRRTSGARSVGVYSAQVAGEVATEAYVCWGDVTDVAQ